MIPKNISRNYQTKKNSNHSFRMLIVNKKKIKSLSYRKFKILWHVYNSLYNNVVSDTQKQHTYTGNYNQMNNILWKFIIINYKRQSSLEVQNLMKRNNYQHN